MNTVTRLANPGRMWVFSPNNPEGGYLEYPNFANRMQDCLFSVDFRNARALARVCRSRYRGPRIQQGVQQEYLHVDRALKRDLMADRLDAYCSVTGRQTNGLSVIKGTDHRPLRKVHIVLFQMSAFP